METKANLKFEKQNYLHDYIITDKYICGKFTQDKKILKTLQLSCKIIKK